MALIFRHLSILPRPSPPSFSLLPRLVNLKSMAGSHSTAIPIVSHLTRLYSIIHTTTNINSLRNEDSLGRADKGFNIGCDRSININVAELEQQMMDCCHRGDNIGAKRLWSEILALGAIPKVEAHGLLVSMYVLRGDSGAAREVIDAMLANRMVSLTFPFSQLIGLYGSVSDKDSAFRVWNDFRGVGGRVDRYLFHAILRVFAAAGDVVGAENIVQLTISDGVSLSIKSHNLLVTAYARSGDYNGVWQRLSIMSSSGIHPDIDTYRAMLLLADPNTPGADVGFILPIVIASLKDRQCDLFVLNRALFTCASWGNRQVGKIILSLMVDLSVGCDMKTMRASHVLWGRTGQTSEVQEHMDKLDEITDKCIANNEEVRAPRNIKPQFSDTKFFKNSKKKDNN